MALAACYLGSSALLGSVIADNSAGGFLLAEVETEGLEVGRISKLESSEKYGEIRTGQICGNHNHDKEFLFGMADVKLMLHPETQIENSWRALVTEAYPKIIILDTTLSRITIDMIKIALELTVIVEAVSEPGVEDFPLTRTFQETTLSGSPQMAHMIASNVWKLGSMLRDAGLIEPHELQMARKHRESLLSRISNISTKAKEAIKSSSGKAVLLLHYVSIFIVTSWIRRLFIHDAEGMLL